MATVQLIEAGGQVYLLAQNDDDDEPFEIFTMMKQASRKQGLSVKTEGGKEEMGAQAQVISNHDDHDDHHDHHDHDNHNDDLHHYHEMENCVNTSC